MNLALPFDLNATRVYIVLLQVSRTPLYRAHMHTLPWSQDSELGYCHMSNGLVARQVAYFFSINFSIFIYIFILAVSSKQLMSIMHRSGCKNT